MSFPTLTLQVGSIFFLNISTYLFVIYPTTSLNREEINLCAWLNAEFLIKRFYVTLAINLRWRQFILLSIGHGIDRLRTTWLNPQVKANIVNFSTYQYSFVECLDFCGSITPFNYKTDLDNIWNKRWFSIGATLYPKKIIWG